jgi:hypothetical protein
MGAEDFRVFSASFEDIRNAVRRVLDEINAKSISWSRDDCVVEARMPFRFATLFAGREELTIVLNRTSGQVWVQSTSSLARDLDFGISHRGNCQNVLNAIARHLDVSKRQPK